MRRAASTVLLAASVLASAPAAWAANDSSLPPVTIDCKQFSKVGPLEWNEIGTAHFKIGNADETLTKTPIKPNSQISAGTDVYRVLEAKCGAH